MALFTLADLHLSFSASKPMDVFGGRWNGYVQQLENAWRSRIRPQDTVVIPGDVSWGMNLEEAKADFEFLEALPGKKILLKGNHDYWWNSLTKMNAFLESSGIKSVSFLQNDAVLTENKIICGSRGWLCEDKMTAQDEKILNRETLRFTLSLKKGAQIREKIGKETGKEPEILCFSHYPLLSSALRQNPVLEILKAYGVKRVYFGHLHNWQNKPLYDSYQNIKLILISSDFCNFIPQKID